MKKNAKPDKCTICIVGPDYPRIGSYTDTLCQAVMVEVEFGWGEYSVRQEDFLFETYRSNYEGDHGKYWSEPYVRTPMWRSLLRGLDMEELDQAQKAMKDFRAFYKKLPIQPRSVDDYVACCLNWRKPQRIRYAYHENAKAPAKEHSDCATIERVVWTIRGAVQKLSELPGKKEAA